ncbi:hypothetical protein HFN89_00925 [Rhizobium laguerreae]|nr:hypothetical protein [Rhizobium laguerreae]
MHILNGILAAIAFGAVASAANAAPVCYQLKPIQAGLVCTPNSTKSADFTSGCQWVAAHMEQVVVQWPSSTPSSWRMGGRDVERHVLRGHAPSQKLFGGGLRDTDGNRRAGLQVSGDAERRRLRLHL